MRLLLLAGVCSSREMKRDSLLAEVWRIVPVLFAIAAVKIIVQERLVWRLSE